MEELFAGAGAGLDAAARRKNCRSRGRGRFYDFLFGPLPDNERALLGPPGSGRQNISGNSILNCLPGIPGVPVGTPLNFLNTPTRFTGANLLACLPAIRAELVQNLANADRSIQAIQLTKQAGPSTLNPVDVPSRSALHVNLGVQREIARDFVVSADFAYRHFDHLGLGQADLNHFNSARGPVIPRCLTEAERNDPQRALLDGSNQRADECWPRDLQGIARTGRQTILARFSVARLMGLFEQHRDQHRGTASIWTTG